MAKEAIEKPKRQHDATYARDRKKGGYLIRVLGPFAGDFAGREVPVRTRDNKEHMETLEKLLWLGIDEGTKELPGTGKPVALYSFVAKPRETIQAEF